MFRQSRYSSPSGRGKSGLKMKAGGAVIYENANRDTVSPEKLASLIKTFEGDYPRISHDQGFGEDQGYGDPTARARYNKQQRSLAYGGSLQGDWSYLGPFDRAVKKEHGDKGKMGLVGPVRDFFMAAGGTITRPYNPYAPSVAPFSRSRYSFPKGGRLGVPILRDSEKGQLTNYKDIGIMDSTQYGAMRPIKVDRYRESSQQNATRPAWQGDYVAPGIVSKRNYIKPITGVDKTGGAGRPNLDPSQETVRPAVGKGYDRMLQLLQEHPALENFEIDPSLHRAPDFLGMDVKEYPSFDPAEKDRKFYDPGDFVYRLRQPAPVPGQAPVPGKKSLPTKGSISGKSPQGVSPINYKPQGYDYLRHRPAPGSITMREKGGTLSDGGWISKAVNPDHKGFCTPMSKSTCTGRRRAFALTMKKHHGFHAEGGKLTQIRKKPGGSNVGKKRFSDGTKRHGPYAGPSGGAPKGSYPIPDAKHAVAALRLAGHAPNPAGIRAAVHKKFPAVGKGNSKGKSKKCLGGTMSKWSSQK